MQTNNHFTELNIFVNAEWSRLNHFVKQNNYSKVLVLVDENTKKYCLPTLKENWSYHDFHVIQIPSGETHKNIGTCNLIWQKMMNAQASRDALLINLGGGVIGDMGGFCASTFKRGIDFIQMPTTLLAQVDASVGGKLGIDFTEIKNGIGLFRHPNAVFIFTDFLKTLPVRQVKSGFAEIIKHTLIADSIEWQLLKKSSDIDLEKIGKRIMHSLHIKANIVQEDPHEKGIRKLLNFGHTIGHAIESYFLKTDKPLLHGEAVAMGMICEAYLSHKIVGLPEEELKSITSFILAYYSLPVLNKRIYPNLIALMNNDKKNIGKIINFTLLKSIGEGVINYTASEALIRESLQYYTMIS